MGLSANTGGLSRVALLASTALIAANTQVGAVDATWLANPGTANLNDDANWTGGVKPDGTASFGASNTTSLNGFPGSAVGGFTFNAGAPAYTFAIGNGRFVGAGIVVNGGSVTVNINGLFDFDNASSAGSATINTSNSFLAFNNTSSAGTANITHNSGFMSFNDTSSAGTATINNIAHFLTFNGSSSASGATITNGGTLTFNDSSSAGSAFITTSIRTEFNGQSTAGTATISVVNFLNFNGNSSAGSAVITGGNGSSVEFNTTDTTSTATATLGSGSVVRGTGALGNTTFNAGAVFYPTAFRINGNLNLGAGSSYLLDFSPTTAGRTNVTGTATLTGATVEARAAGSSFTGKTYTIINAASIVGTFAGLTVTGNLGTRVRNPHLVYDANNVFLVLDPGTIVLPSGAGSNQNKVASGINSAVQNGAAPPPGFDALLNLTGDALTNALSQVSGVSTGGASQGATQMMTSFLTTILSPASGGGPNSGAPGAIGFAREIGVGDWALSPVAAQAYAAVTPRDRRPPAAEPYAAFAPKLTVWGQAYGGYNKVDGVASAGASDTTARTYGLATGFDYRLMPDLTVGFALAGGSTSWGLSPNLGGGRSDVFQVGVYGVRTFGAAYVSGAVAYAWHDVTTDRSVTVAGTDKLESQFDAQSFGARAEGGYRFATLAGGVTPYAALQVQNFRTPAHSETAVTGSNTFALAYDASSTTVTRFELGSWFDRLFIVPDGSVLAIRTRVAWANDHSNGGSVSALFQTLPGSSFSVDGAKAAPNSALLSAAADWRLASRVTVGARLDSEFASRSQTYAATGRVSYAW